MSQTLKTEECGPSGCPDSGQGSRTFATGQSIAAVNMKQVKADQANVRLLGF